VSHSCPGIDLRDKVVAALVRERSNDICRKKGTFDLLTEVAR
jgi:hypothetical protein